MNYEKLKQDMDVFFDTVSTEKLVNDLKDMGHTFSNITKQETQKIENTVFSIPINILYQLPSMAYFLEDLALETYTTAA